MCTDRFFLMSLTPYTPETCRKRLLVLQKSIEDADIHFSTFNPFGTWNQDPRLR